MAQVKFKDTAKLNLSINQGATYRKQLVYKAGPTNAPVPVDLTGYTARMQARESQEATAVLVELATENGGITLGGAAGTIDLYISATATAAFTWTSAVYDLELIAPNGDVLRKVEGSITVRPEVTRG
jgi:hypothetical protein